MASDRRILFDERLRCLPSGTVALVVEQLWGSTCCWRESWVIINCALRVLNIYKYYRIQLYLFLGSVEAAVCPITPKLVTYFVK